MVNENNFKYTSAKAELYKRTNPRLKPWVKKEKKLALAKVKIKL